LRHPLLEDSDCSREKAFGLRDWEERACGRPSSALKNKPKPRNRVSRRLMTTKREAALCGTRFLGGRQNPPLAA